MERRGLTPDMLDQLAAQAVSLAEAQALAAQADRLRGLAAQASRAPLNVPILRN